MRLSGVSSSSSEDDDESSERLRRFFFFSFSEFDVDVIAYGYAFVFLPCFQLLVAAAEVVRDIEEEDNHPCSASAILHF